MHSEGAKNETDSLEVKKVLDKLVRNLNISSSAHPTWAIRLKLLPNLEEKICMTTAPNSLKSDFKWWEETITIKKDNPAIERTCIFVEEQSKFTELTREELLAHFDSDGRLKSEFRGKNDLEFNSNQDFIYALIQNGFYVFRGCFDGTLSAF